MFLLLHLCLGGRAHLDLRHAAGQFGQPFLQFLAIVVAGRVLDLLLDLSNTALDVFTVPLAPDDRGVVLVGLDLLRPAEHVYLHRLELDANIVGDHFRAGEHGHVLQHRLASIAVAWRLHGDALQHAAQFVHDQRGQCLTLHVLGDDHQRLPEADDLLHDRDDVTRRADLLLRQEDVGFLEHALHLVGVGDEVR